LKRKRNLTFVGVHFAEREAMRLRVGLTALRATKATQTVTMTSEMLAVEIAFSANRFRLFGCFKVAHEQNKA